MSLVVLHEHLQNRHSELQKLQENMDHDRRRAKYICHQASIIFCNSKSIGLSLWNRF
ncbi:hypothetical protein [Azospirillum argentinense]